MLSLVAGAPYSQTTARPTTTERPAPRSNTLEANFACELRTPDPDLAPVFFNNFAKAIDPAPLFERQNCETQCRTLAGNPASSNLWTLAGTLASVAAPDRVLNNKKWCCDWASDQVEIQGVEASCKLVVEAGPPPDDRAIDVASSSAFSFNTEDNGGQSVGDPHFFMPHGGRADFCGQDHALYNLLSARNISLNVMTENATFELHKPEHPRHKHVKGSFLTQAHLVVRTFLGKLVRLSFWADVIGPTSMTWANGTVDAPDGTRVTPGAFKLGVHADKTIDDVRFTTDWSTLRATTSEFEIAITPINLRTEKWANFTYVKPELNVVGPHHRLDVSIKLRVPEPVLLLATAPHGIIGQAWDGDGLAIDGEIDVYPEKGDFTTAANAKGAIEGTIGDYRMATPYATAFKFSRFDSSHAAPRDVAKLVAAGVLNKPKKAVQDVESVGATEYRHMEL